MKKKKHPIRALTAGLLSLALALSGVPHSTAVEMPPVMRVALTIEGQSVFEAPQLENAQGFAQGYQIGTVQGTSFVPAASTQATALTMRVQEGAIVVTDTQTDEVLYTAPEGQELAILPNSEQTWFREYRWNGFFVYRIAGENTLSVLNYVGIEDYVKGVLPYEMSPSWPLEALKAQAVCARSYALGTTKHAAQGYDLCNTTNCQVYLGANNRSEVSDTAVDGTRGMVPTAQGKMAVGYYFSSSGGATEDAENVWGTPVSYLRGRVDVVEENAATWSVTMTTDEITRKLQAASYPIGTVAGMQVTHRTAMGNVAEVIIIDTEGKAAVLSREAVRNVLGLKSLRYQIEPGTDAVQEVAQEESTQVAQEESAPVAATAFSREGVGRPFGLLAPHTQVPASGISLAPLVSPPSTAVAALPAHNLVLRTMHGETRATLASASAQTETATPSSHRVLLNGQPIAPCGYNIAGYNYYKLRDLAYVLSDTNAAFSIGWSNEKNTIFLAQGAYEPVGGELQALPSSQSVQATPSTAAIVWEQQPLTLEGYHIAGNNYYKLRDVAQAMGFLVDFENDTVRLSTKEYTGSPVPTDPAPIDPTYPSVSAPTQSDLPLSPVAQWNDAYCTAPTYTFTGTGWGHSVGMSQWGAYTMAQHGKSYTDILNFYFTDITLKTLY